MCEMARLIKFIILFEVALSTAFLNIPLHSICNYRSLRSEDGRGAINIKLSTYRNTAPILIMNAFPYADIVLTEPNDADVSHLASLLSNISSHLRSEEPAESVLEIQREMKFCYSRDVPRLANKLLQDFPAYRDDEKMAQAYSFLIDILELSTNETLAMAKRYQILLNDVLSSAKLGEMKLNETLTALSSQVTSAEFLAYIDSEIENQDPGNSAHSLLITVKLAILESFGNLQQDKTISIIPKITAIDDPTSRRINLLQEFERFGDIEKQTTFIKSLQGLIDQIQYYHTADSVLVSRMIEMERICSDQLTINIVHKNTDRH